MFAKEDVKKRVIDFLILFVAGILTYSQLMVHNLVNNYDGIWEWSAHNANAWELSIGRWFWLYLSRLRFGLAPDPVTSIISLAIFAAGIIVSVEVLEVKSRFATILFGVLVLFNPALCSQLSYRYMSPTFATAFLLAVLAVWFAVKIKKVWLSILLGSISVALSMGSYQAFLGCTCVLIIAWFIKGLLSDKDIKACLLSLINPIASVLCGGVLYIIALKLHQKLLHVEMADYLGGDSYSIINTLKNFFTSTKGAYQIGFLFTRDTLIRTNRLAKYHIFTIVWAALLIFIAYEFVKLIVDKKIAKAIALFVAVLLLAPAAYAVNYIATGTGVSVQMFGSWFFIAPAVYAALPIEFKEKSVRKILTFALSFVLVVTAYGGFYQVVTDQNAMYEGKVSTENIIDLTMAELANKGLLGPEYTYCFLTCPPNSPLWRINSGYANANQYAVFGAWWAGFNAEKSWRGVVNGMCELNLNFVNNAQYDDIMNSGLYEDIPQFPAEGSIVLIDDNIVIINY